MSQHPSKNFPSVTIRGKVFKWISYGDGGELERKWMSSGAEKTRIICNI